MGIWASKPEEPATPETPSYSKYGKILSFDPRSPGENRTPLLIQDPSIDPRSPSNEIVDRTPIFAIPEPEDFSPNTPNVRYKIDNDAYEESPLSIIETQQSEEINEVEEEEEESAVGDVLDNKKENSDYKSEYLSVNADELDKVMTSLDNMKVNEKESTKGDEVQTTPPARQKRKNSRRKMQQPMLKTVLFKPYEDLDEDKENDVSQSVSPSPVHSKKFVALVNENSPSDKVDLEKRQALRERNRNDANVVKKKLGLQQRSGQHNKENMRV